MERPNGLNMDSLHTVERLLTDNPLHIKRLRYVYSVSEQIIKKLNWQDISNISKPVVLLCGTGSPTTTLEYTNHIRRYNSDAQIAVLDLSACRLDRSKKKVYVSNSVSIRRKSHFLKNPIVSSGHSDFLFCQTQVTRR